MEYSYYSDSRLDAVAKLLVDTVYRLEEYFVLLNYLSANKRQDFLKSVGDSLSMREPTPIPGVWAGVDD